MEVSEKMRYAVDPRQTTLFEPASVMFSPMTIKYLSSDWPGVFRYQMLHLMPAGRLRVRGSPRVRMAVLLRCAGWNLFRALAAMKQRGIANFVAFFAAWTLTRTLAGRLRRWIEAPDAFRPHQTASGRESPMLAVA